MCGFAFARQNKSAVAASAWEIVVASIKGDKPTVSGLTSVRSEVFYSGARPGTVTVREGGAHRTLSPRADLRQNASGSFTWGPAERSPTLLSLSLLADALGNDERALNLHQRFHRRVVTMLPERWTMSRSRVIAHAEMIEHRAAIGIDKDQ